MTKRAFITGITGQDGSYLADLLVAKGYEVFGLIRHTSTPSYERIEHLLDKITLIEGDLLDQESINNALWSCEPHEIYNLAAQSFVGTSWTQPALTSEITGIGCLRVLEAAKELADSSSKVTPRFYQASSSEMFGKTVGIAQNEKTAFHPRSPYGVAKVYAHYMTLNYRESYGLHASCGILFNHESPRRGKEFVTQKIALGARAIADGRQDHIALGNLEAKRDWGHAKDYVRAMWMMLQQDEPRDYVIATGETHTVDDFARLAFASVGITDYKSYIKLDPKFVRPAEVDYLLGDASSAKFMLGWEPEISFNGLVEDMTKALETV